MGNLPLNSYILDVALCVYDNGLGFKQTYTCENGAYKIRFFAVLESPFSLLIICFKVKKLGNICKEQHSKHTSQLYVLKWDIK